MNRTLEDVLCDISRTAKTTRSVGSKFEHLCKLYLETDGLYVDQFSNVWLWDDVENPIKGQRADYGIDIVAEYSRSPGIYCVIQCKYRSNSDSTLLSADEINKFLACGRKIGDNKIDGKILIHTARGLTGIGATKLENNSCQVIQKHDLENSSVDWGALYQNRSARKAQYTLHKHQSKAVNDIVRGLGTHNRGTLVMACGTGKTFVTLKIAEQLAGAGKTVLYLVPSIGLMQQTIREWSNQRSVNPDYIGVCSDTSVGKDGEDASLLEIPIDVTTNDRIIADHLLSRSNDKMTVVFSTYHSIFQVSKGQKRAKIDFDLVICDEAHRTTGVSSKDNTNSKKDTRDFFTAIHDDKIISAKKRLYTTATPKVYTQNSKERGVRHNLTIYSMDDENIFGPKMHTLSFVNAIDQDILTDYCVVVLDIKEKDAVELLQYLQSKVTISNDKVSVKKELSLDDAAKLLGCWKALRDSNALLKEIAKTKKHSIGGGGWYEKSSFTACNLILA